MHRTVLVAALIQGMLAPSSHAQLCDTEPPIELIASNASGYARAGHSVAAAGDIVVVGAYGDETLAVGAGSVKVYRLNGGAWTEEAELLPPVPTVGDWFGYSVATDGERIVVGVPYADTTVPASGKAIVFRDEPGSGWVVETELTAPTPQFEDRFGNSIAIDQDRIIVGAPQRDVGVTNNAGSVCVFRLTDGTWIFEDELNTGSSVAHANAGWSVDIDGSSLVVGAPGDNHPLTGGSDGGSAYVFDITDTGFGAGIELEPELDNTDGAFGWSVAIDDDTIAVGSPDSYESGNPPGSFNFTRAGYVTVFELNDGLWLQSQAILPAYGPADTDHFGDSIALRGSRLVIGGIGRGYIAGYMHNGIQWQLQTGFLFAPDGIQTRSQFGTAVAISDFAVVVGADSTDFPDTNAGSAFVYATSCPCPGDFDGNGALNFFDISAYVAAFNAGDPAADRAEPFGVINFFDLSAFIADFQIACP